LRNNTPLLTTTDGFRELLKTWVDKDPVRMLENDFTGIKVSFGCSAGQSEGRWS
jgi:hypothetical protein